LGEEKMICKNCGCGIKETNAGFRHCKTEVRWIATRNEWIVCCICGCDNPESVLVWGKKK
jgi:hypothetical protein